MGLNPGEKSQDFRNDIFPQTSISHPQFQHENNSSSLNQNPKLDNESNNRAVGFGFSENDFNLNSDNSHNTHERRFVCKFCSKSYIRKHNLIIHIRTHTQERPYKCDHCSKAFSAKSSLNRHIRLYSIKN